ncbi:MAG: amidase [Aestuariivirga sp.]|uniref:amidase n=1 Tax=Aestuariivirga sp. TaxID=2650926 RepID=UPI0025C5069F|nr:amidase family protein [Aestuariivirga sp.]MCA3560819.1 amidase [Aestuariivirga sp.]
MTDLIRLTAVKVVQELKTGDITPLDCLDALEARIAAVDGAVNALPTRCFDRARSHARKLMEKPSSARGPLAGLPVPIKDLADVAGVRSTQGSPIYKDRIAETSDLLVTHLEGNGGVIYAMSNTPEFGAGAHTFNEVFGVTRNPWNTALSASGSSGGAAVALATGMAWVAHGSDLGGSLRNPASFCGVVGMRPSPGRVAATVFSKIDSTLGVEGPMARNVQDLALFFDAMVGEEPADPLSLPSDGTSFLKAARSGWKPKRVAVSRDLGLPPVDKRVADLVLAAARKLEKEGVIVEEAHPDLRETRECAQTLRALSYANMRPLLDKHRDLLKAEVVWNIEKGLALTGAEIARAEAQRGELFRRMRAFFETYDLLLCPTTIVPPFPVAQRYVAECDGVKLETYVDWLMIVHAVTLTASPAISIPCGFTADHLPVGLQIVAPGRGEAKLLAGARFIEQVLDLGVITPIDPRT